MSTDRTGSDPAGGRVDARLRSALAELETEVARRVTVPPPPRPGLDRPAARAPQRTISRRLVPLAAAAAVVALAGIGVAVRDADRGGPPTPGTRPSVTATPTPEPSESPTPTPDPPAGGASQSPDDAARDRVPDAVAALSLDDRAQALEPMYRGATTSVATPEGTYVVARPRVQVPSHPEYGEVLLLSPDGTRVLKAWPMDAAPPQWLTVTKDAVYCGRTGDGGLPWGMLCRIDRSSGELTVRVLSCRTSDTVCPAFTGLKKRPGTWTVSHYTDPPVADGAKPVAGSLVVTDPQGKRTMRVDPVTLRDA